MFILPAYLNHLFFYIIQRTEYCNPCLSVFLVLTKTVLCLLLSKELKEKILSATSQSVLLEENLGTLATLDCIVGDDHLGGSASSPVFLTSQTFPLLSFSFKHVSRHFFTTRQRTEVAGVTHQQEGQGLPSAQTCRSF